MEAEIAMVFDIDGASIIPWGAYPGIRTGVNASAF